MAISPEAQQWLINRVKNTVQRTTTQRSKGGEVSAEKLSRRQEFEAATGIDTLPSRTQGPVATQERISDAALARGEGVREALDPALKALSTQTGAPESISELRSSLAGDIYASGAGLGFTSEQIEAGEANMNRRIDANEEVQRMIRQQSALGFGLGGQATVASQGAGLGSDLARLNAATIGNITSANQNVLAAQMAQEAAIPYGISHLGSTALLASAYGSGGGTVPATNPLGGVNAPSAQNVNTYIPDAIF